MSYSEYSYSSGYEEESIKQEIQSNNEQEQSNNQDEQTKKQTESEKESKIITSDKNDETSNEEEETINATLAPEPDIKFNFEESEDKAPTEEFRKRHPLFDTPNIIDEQDQLITDKQLSSDEEEIEPLIATEQDEEEPIQAIPTSLSPEPDKTTQNSSLLLPNDSILGQTVENQEIDQTDIPEWKRFSLPPFSPPDVSAIEAQILSQFEIPKLLNEIRSND